MRQLTDADATITTASFTSQAQAQSETKSSNSSSNSTDAVLIGTTTAAGVVFITFVIGMLWFKTFRKRLVDEKRTSEFHALSALEVESSENAKESVGREFVRHQCIPGPVAPSLPLRSNVDNFDITTESRKLTGKDTQRETPPSKSSYSNNETFHNEVQTATDPHTLLSLTILDPPIPPRPYRPRSHSLHSHLKPKNALSPHTPCPPLPSPRKSITPPTTPSLHSTRSSTSSMSSTCTNTFPVLLSHHPRQPDELCVTPHDRVVVTRVFEDGWCEGFIHGPKPHSHLAFNAKVTTENKCCLDEEDSSRKGIFPLNCIRLSHAPRAHWSSSHGRDSDSLASYGSSNVSSESVATLLRVVAPERRQSLGVQMNVM
ncbi:hypothetical protein BC832DRAFT_622742 [Gaertneriomyces semiglobifer]|nr:hypothetical protein BC832DRAFT_622742 [Gaertneriomyces semiglobifer]